MCQQRISRDRKSGTIDVKSRFDKSNGEDNQAKITWLRKAREIRSGFSKGDASYFLKITSICFDNLNDNLYVADSELHRIFKFNNNGDYITSFGSEGQGPGELLGIIRISVGNDGILYATDDANMRIIAFSKEGEFIRQIPAFGIPGDIALVNSKGEIYLLSPSGLRIIDFFDSNMKLLRSLLDMSYYLDFPFDRPPQKRLNRMILGPSIHDVKKLLTQDDELILIFSNTLTVISFDKKNSIINRFRVGHPIFLKDYKKRLKRIISAGGWLNSFGSVFVDNNSREGRRGCVKF